MMDKTYDTTTPEKPVFEWKDVKEFPLGVIGIREEDGVQHWILHTGYEDLKLFEVPLSNGDKDLILGNLDEHGTICHTSGDDAGLNWDSVSSWSHIPN